VKSKKYDGAAERQVLIGLITNVTVGQRISSQWTGTGLFSSSWANMIGNWCVDHVREYSEAPLLHITNIFETWAANTTADAKVVHAIDSFLQSHLTLVIQIQCNFHVLPFTTY